MCLQLSAGERCLKGETTMTIHDLDTPTLLVDLDRLERNITEMARTVGAGGKALRPHTKTHKTPEIARMQAAAGAHGLTVAKLAEAEALADAGFDDLFIANQVVGPQKMERLTRLAGRVQLIVSVDSVEGAELLGDAAARAGIRLRTRIEVDTGLGRAGTRSQGEALAVARFVADHKRLELDGIFTHEGQIYQAKDARSSAAVAAEQMRALASLLAAESPPVRAISMGSTPGAPLLAREAGVTELRPGVYVFNDRTQLRLGAPHSACALTVLATVTSVRPDGRVIVDAGTKAMASDCEFEDGSYGEIVGRPELRSVGASEEHGHLLAEAGSTVRIGDRVRILPNHACTCTNMHDTMFALRGDTVEAEWRIAGRGKIR
jgi:D-serine deaminase-like pyridoxal phosphate-dependent protein